MVDRVWLYFTPHGGPSVRVFIAVYMAATGLARVITGNSASGVNIFSARVFGAFLIISGALLFLTVPSRYRCFWSGRLCAIIAAVIWSLLIAQAWPTGAWVSITGAFVYIAFLLNEVRANGR